MTNYIEEMMRTAGVKPNYRYFIDNKIIGCPILDAYVVDKYEIRQIRFSSGFYKVWSVTKEFPDFTAKKQLEIIKLICKNTLGKDYRSFNQERDEITGFYHLSLINHEYKHKTFHVKNEDFSQALAQLTTELMNAGELDGEKVKEILSK